MLRSTGGWSPDTQGELLDTPAGPECTLVLVTYRSRHHVESLLELWDGAFPVIVVDNAGDADGIGELVGPGVSVLDGGGQGFARAANRGAVAARTPYVAFVNPDCRPTVDDLVSLVSGLAGDPGALSHAATMVGADEDVEVGVGGWEPSPRRAIVFGLGAHKLFRTAGIYAKPDLGEQLEVGWTTGACMVVRRSDFLGVGGFDESFFVYCEDLSLGRRARRAGLRQVLRSDVVVRHGAGSSGAPSLEMLRLRGASFANYVHRYHPRGALLMRAALAGGYVLRATHRWARGDEDEAQQFAAYVKGVATRRAYVAGDEVALLRMKETDVVPGA